MFSENPKLLKKYEMNALKDHKRYGAEPCVNLVYEENKKMGGTSKCLIYQ